MLYQTEEGIQTLSDLLRNGVEDFLKANGYNSDDPNFKGTPDRVVKAWSDLIKPIGEVKETAISFLAAADFPSKYTGILLVPRVQVTGMCPHHLLPVLYRISFAYIPDKTVVGLSKIPRYLKEMGKMLVLQEDLTEHCLQWFEDKVRPKGCMIIIDGKHMCMRARGVKEDAPVRTMGVRGTFIRLETKEEVLSSLRERY